MSNKEQNNFNPNVSLEVGYERFKFANQGRLTFVTRALKTNIL